VWSHVDFDAIVVAGPDRDLTRAILHADADHPPAWAPTADGQLGRKLPGLVHESNLELIAVAVHLTASVDLAGDALARVDEIAAAVQRDDQLTDEDIAAWRRQIDDSAAEGRFLFCEPCFVIDARAPRSRRA
jgi:hypothetical protein